MRTTAGYIFFPLTPERAVELYRSGYSINAIAKTVGCHHQTVRRRLLAIGEPIKLNGAGTVPVAALAEAFRRMEPGPPATIHAPPPKDAACLIAERLGWYERGHADGARVRRVLGLRPYAVGGCASDPRRRIFRACVAYETALRLCEAMEFDPVDLGL